MEKVLRKILGKPDRQGRELLFKCPTDACKGKSKKKLSINIEKGAFKCWVCGYKGSDLIWIIQRYGSEEDKQIFEGYEKIHKFDSFFADEPTEEKKPIVLPESFKTLTGKIKPTSLEARNYLRKRGVSARDIALFRLGYCTNGRYAGRIICPSFDKEGNLNFFVGRTYQGHFMKYDQPSAKRNEIIFNELLIDWGQPVILVEGIFDAIVAGTNAIPILGSSLNEGSRLFQKICKEKNRIFLGMDPEAANKQQEIAEMFFDYGLSVSFVSPCPYEDIGAMPKGEFEKAWQDSIGEEMRSKIDIIKKKYGVC